MKNLSNEVKKKKKEYETQLSSIKIQLQSIPTTEEHLNPEIIEKAILYGKLQQYKDIFIGQEEKLNIKDLENQIDILEASCRKNNWQDQMNDIVKNFITPLIQEMEGSRNDVYHLDIKDVTISQITKESLTMLPLHRIGSGESIAYIKLGTYIGLHKYMKKHNRPLPNFFIIDQFSQTHQAIEENTDREKLENTYTFFKKNASFLQIILFERGLPKNKEGFHIIELKDNNKLIPSSWIETG